MKTLRALESMIQDLLSHRYHMEPMNIAFVSRELCQKNRLQFFVRKQDPGLACIPVPSHKHKDELLLALSIFLSGVAQLSFCSFDFER